MYILSASEGRDRVRHGRVQNGWQNHESANRVNQPLRGGATHVTCDYPIFPTPQHEPFHGLTLSTPTRQTSIIPLTDEDLQALGPTGVWNEGEYTDSQSELTRTVSCELIMFPPPCQVWIHYIHVNRDTQLGSRVLILHYHGFIDALHESRGIEIRGNPHCTGVDVPLIACCHRAMAQLTR